MKEYFLKLRASGKAFSNTLRERGILKGIFLTLKVIRNIVLTAIVIGLMFAFLGVGAGAGYFASLVKDAEIPNYELMEEKIYNYEMTSQVYFANDTLLGNLRTDLDRKETSLENISDYVINAIIATEDNYFYEHDGIVPKALARATYQEVTGSDVRSGGSTLTQQLVKNQMLTREVSFERKAKEILLALRLERFFDKDDILEAYLNVVPFGRNASGQNVAGVEATARGVFGVNAKDLNLPQAAFIAGLPQNPFGYTPFNNDGSVKESIDHGLRRMKTVLARMQTSGFITEEEYEEALAYDIKDNLTEPKPTPQEEYPDVHYEVERRATEIIAMHFANEDDYDGDEMAANYKEYGYLEYESRVFNKPIEEVAESKEVNLAETKKNFDFFTEYLQNADSQIRQNGYHIHTTINKEIYDAMQSAKNGVLDNRNYFQAAKTAEVTDSETGETITKEYPMQVGAMLIENKTGQIISFVGGRDYNESQLNHATQAYRSNGSTMKPLLDYAPAMELGKVQPGYMLADTPVTEVPDWDPKNYGGGHQGLVTAREAFKKSINIPAIRTFLRMDPFEATSYLKKMGFDSLPESDRYNPSISIGGLKRGFTVEENTNAFTTFANDGKFIDSYMIHKITSNDGESIYEHESTPVDVFSPQTSYLTIDMMRDVLYGGGTASRLPGYLTFQSDWAGKTGTSQEWEDSWMVALNPNVTLGVWTGYDKPMSLDSNNYAHRTQRLWALLANAAYDANSELMNPESRFEMPEGIVRRSFCGISGLLPSEECKRAGLVQTDLFNVKFIPKESDDSLESIRYVTLNGENYLALDSTPSEFTQQGVNIKSDYFTGVDLSSLLSDRSDGEYEIATEHAEENGKQPDAVTGISLHDGTLSWSEHPESDIVGYRIYHAEEGDKTFTEIGSVATFDETTSYSVAGNAYDYYVVTAVDVAGNESPASETMTGNYERDDDDDDDYEHSDAYYEHFDD